MNRLTYIELIRREVYGGQPSDDATLTVGLCNQWLNIAIGVAAKTNYRENLSIDGISYVNNSFYTTFKGLEVTKDENFLWKIELPQIPLGLGASDGVSTLVFKSSSTAEISYPVVWLTQNQKSFQKGMRSIPNKLLAYSEGQYVYVLSTIQLSQYTAQVTMVSGGDSTNLQSTINVPDDYFPVIVEYMKKELGYSLAVPVDDTNDGRDVNPSA